MVGIQVEEFTLQVRLLFSCPVEVLMRGIERTSRDWYVIKQLDRTDRADENSI
jgi:hypothetical protein